jgi:hypothetical protein
MNFEQVKTTRTRKWRENGKWRKQTRTFMHTVNPFNKDEEGMPKSYTRVTQDVNAEADAWVREKSTPKTPKESEQ